MLFFLLKSWFKWNILFREVESKDGLCSPSIWRQGLFYCKTKVSRTEKSDISFDDTASDFFSLHCILSRNTKNGATKCFASRLLLILMTEIYTWPFKTVIPDSLVDRSFMEYMDQANKDQNEFPWLWNLLCCLKSNPKPKYVCVLKRKNVNICQLLPTRGSLQVLS